MGYNRIVVWPDPYTGQSAPLGKFSTLYTKVLVDIPTIDKTYNLWQTSPTCNFGTNNIIEFFTALHYKRNSLKLYADGVLIPEVIEGNLSRNEVFKINSNYINGHYIHVEYVPFDEVYYRGDNIQVLKRLFNVIADTQSNINIRNFIEKSRYYINYLKLALSIEPPLWIGGIGNMENGVYNNLISSLTPAVVEYHLKTLTDHIYDIINHIDNNIRNQLVLPGIPEYTAEFIENIQESLTSIDIVLDGSLP